MLVFVLLLCAGIVAQPCVGYPSIDAAPASTPEDSSEKTTDSVRDDAVSRKVLGSSVVTSVSVIMDTGSEKLYSDAVGRPQVKPSLGSQVASPINLLNPDRYEFYTFSDSGDLVKRLMTLSEIQGIIANADGEAFNHNSHSPEKKVNDVVSNVQNVLKSEIEKGSVYNASNNILDTPDVSSSWSVILPAIFGNSGEEIKPVRPQTSMTPETIMLEHSTTSITKKPLPQGFTTRKPSKVTTEKEILKKPTTYKVPGSTLKAPTTTKKPLKLSTTTITTPTNTPTTTKKVTVRTTPTTAIPRITTRGTRPNKRPTTTTTTTTIAPPTTGPVLVQVRSTTASSIGSYDTTAASSQFIQLFDPVQTLQTTVGYKTTQKPIFIRTTPRISSLSTPGKIASEGALFIVDEKTNTRIPITTKEQLASLLNKFESTTEVTNLKNASPLITLNSVSGHHTPLPDVPEVLDSAASTTNHQVQEVQSTTSGFADLDIEKYQQLLLTSTNIYEINKELAKSTTTTSTSKPVRPSLTLRTTPETPTTTSAPPTTSITTTKVVPTEVPSKVSDMLSSTLKEPNLVNSIEQLIQQAVGNIQEVTQRTTTTTTTTTTSKPTTEEKISTTIAPTTEELPTSTSTTPELSSDDLLINEAMGSLLSQVVGSDFQGLTTLQELPTTTAEILSKPQGESLEYRIKTTDIFSESTESPGTTTIGTTTDDLGSATTNEILKTDATTYNINTSNNNTLGDIDGTTDNVDSTTTEVPETTTTELVEDLPIVFDVGNKNLPTTTEKKIINEETLETLKDTISTTLKPTSVGVTTLTTTEEILGNKLEDSDSLPSTNNYKEVTSNIADTETDDTTDTDKKEASTLSIEELIKELTTKNDAYTYPEVPKETTVLIITKPLYTTSPTTTTTTTTTTEIPGTPTTLETTANTETSTIPPTTSVTPGISKEPEWTIVSTIAPHNTTEQNTTKTTETETKIPQPSRPVELNPMPQLSGLEETTKHLDQDIYQFVALCNELAFGFWKSVTTGISSARSVVLSPFAATSLLAMVFLGARGATSGEMNEILRLDDMVSFNPHLIFKNVSESIQVSKKEGVATSVILRELYSDKSKGDLLNFYKERAKAFYDGHVEEVSFKEIGDVIRRRTNLIVKKLTDGKIPEYIKDSSITVKSPLAGVSASIFQTDCSDASIDGRDGELYFVVLPSIRQRRLVPVPAAVWRGNFLAGYDPLLDATAVALGDKLQTTSTIFVIPGQQGIAAPGDGLARLERSLIGGAFKDKSWSRLLMTLIPRPGLEVQIPRFQHRSVINATVALQQMGMKDLFDAAKADLRGLNGVANDLYLSDILQVNNFATCGEEIIGETHHSEIYPATANRTYRRSRKFKDTLPPEGAYYDSELSEEPRDYQRAFHDPLHDPSLYALPLPLRPRQARLPDPPRLRFDRPFLYFVRHNPTGLILHMGRFNPRLLP